MKYYYMADGEANKYTISRGSRWIANILLNGELSVPEQRQIMQQMVDSLNRTVSHEH